MSHENAVAAYFFADGRIITAIVIAALNEKSINPDLQIYFRAVKNP